MCAREGGAQQSDGLPAKALKYNDSRSFAVLLEGHPMIYMPPLFNLNPLFHINLNPL